MKQDACDDERYGENEKGSREGIERFYCCKVDFSLKPQSK